jgi:phosphoglycolate phosphatase-like HAD superfamily hydrolase
MCRLLRDEVSSSGDDDIVSRSRIDSSLGQPDMITFSVGDERSPISDDYADVHDAKPRPLGLIRAAKALGAGKDIKLVDGYMVGDRVNDVRAGRAAGCKSILVMTGLGKEAAAQVEEGAVMHVADDIVGAAQAIIEDFGRKKPEALR